ncbi:hypothetical protein ISU10_17230 [Nocardioides agariphilus]|jgi:hypothetical protein|uniref:Uncharacterized protein n=1 Tax=Nocardioides agariphilus TaxID=433664 RepID=A0A930YNU1_9ACTN|nr:hypothetical protein [Nocardioides agariphilus]MBF4769514.1 hypothetical protein [Nocardioides agariphilus]
MAWAEQLESAVGGAGTGTPMAARKAPNRYAPERGSARVVETFEEKTGMINAYPKGRRIQSAPIPVWLTDEAYELLEAHPG